MAFYTIRSGASQHPESTVLQLITDLIAKSGVIGLAAGDLLVSQQASPDMSVKIATGRAWIKGTGNGYPVRSDAAATVPITANASGNPRKDAIVIYVNLSATPANDGSGVITAAAIAGTPAASPSAPDDATIQSAIGASNPFLRLADATVASGASSILDANVTDMRVALGINGSVLYSNQMVTNGGDSNIDIEVKPKGTGIFKSKTTLQLTAFAPTVDVETGDGKNGFRVPKELAGMNLVGVAASVTTSGTTGTEDIQIRRVRSGSAVDMLSTKITIDSGEVDSSTAATPAVINTSNDDVAEADQIYIDIDAKHTTAAKGTFVHLTFATP